MSLKSDINNLLKNNPNIVEYNLYEDSDKAPKVHFKLNTGNGQHTDKHGDIYEYNRFYEFEGRIHSPEDLTHRLKYRKPPE